MAGWLLRPGARVRLHAGPLRFRMDLLRSVLRVGLPASLSPVMSNVSIAVATAATWRERWGA